jgi:hypothetical protein
MLHRVVETETAAPVVQHKYDIGQAEFAKKPLDVFVLRDVAVIDVGLVGLP